MRTTKILIVCDFCNTDNNTKSTSNFYSIGYGTLIEGSVKTISPISYKDICSDCISKMFYPTK
jgi:ubiquitin C-terminal hydrolase